VNHHIRDTTAMAMNANKMIAEDITSLEAILVITSCLKGKIIDM
jgi:hypothetical protein